MHLRELRGQEWQARVVRVRKCNALQCNCDVFDPAFEHCRFSQADGFDDRLFKAELGDRVPGRRCKSG